MTVWTELVNQVGKKTKLTFVKLDTCYGLRVLTAHARLEKFDVKWDKYDLSPETKT